MYTCLYNSLLGPCLPLIGVLSISSMQCNALKTHRLLYSLNCTFHTCQLGPHNLGILFTQVIWIVYILIKCYSICEFSTPIEAGLPVHWLYVWNYMCLSSLYGAAAVTIDNAVFLIPFVEVMVVESFFTRFLYYNFAIKIPYLSFLILSKSLQVWVHTHHLCLHRQTYSTVYLCLSFGFTL